MYGYIYKFTFLPTGDWYIGQHKYENKTTLDKGYWGSGSAWKNLIQQYDKSLWPDLITREILGWYASEVELNEAEDYWVEHLCARKHGLNIAPGGGQFPILFGEDNGMWGHQWTEEQLSNLRAGIAKYYESHDGWSKGLTKDTDERLQHISEALMGHEVSEDAKQKLSTYFTGRILVTNGETSINIDPQELDEWESRGYWRGVTKKDTRKRVWVINNDDLKFVPEEELEYYLSLGYEHKGPNAGKPSWNAGKKCPQLGHNQSGENNGNFGKFKYTNGIDSIRCRPGEEPEGYYRSSEWRKMHNAN